jgi:hypothetical protein
MSTLLMLSDRREGGIMPKGQQRGNREKKKPKQTKAPETAKVSIFATPPGKSAGLVRKTK